ncbi:amidohydrolase family protein [Pseudarthrobacter phenanthrenivorans]|uniref:amidohydrolase family protein n=1 Tax=Pseudarthrobacter phenanthrenivorans TaxID=361575 RepID=UPI002F359125
MMVIDAHQHVWDPERASYPWLNDSLAPINRKMQFGDVVPSLRRANVQATVLVQSADNDEDTDLMFETAQEHPGVTGIVAYVPLENPARARERLDQLLQSDLTVGVRNLIHNIPNPDWLLLPEVGDGLSLVEDSGLTFDLVGVLPRHLEIVSEVSRRHSRLRIVLDHLGKPPIGCEDAEPWWSLIERAAQNPNVFAKISGLYSASGAPDNWTAATVRPFVDRALEVFGSERLMYGGDWPISITAGGYDRVWDGLNTVFADYSEAERTSILGGTATSFYRLSSRHLAAAKHELHPALSSTAALI